MTVKAEAAVMAALWVVLVLAGMEPGAALAVALVAGAWRGRAALQRRHDRKVARKPDYQAINRMERQMGMPPSRRPRP